MKDGEGRFLLGFLLIGLSPVLACASAVLTGIIFAVGMVISSSVAFS